MRIGRNCTAVSTYIDTSDHEDGLMLTEAAGTWSAGVEAVLPADADTTRPLAELRSVSCASAGNCAAVGDYQGSSPEDGLLLTETAGIWATGEKASLPANDTPPNPLLGDYLQSVSCPSAGSCNAVGNYWDYSSNEQGLLMGGNPPTVKLETSKNGTGSGTVSSVQIGIDCGSTCTASFDSGTKVALTARPSAGSRFSGWSGGGCPRGSPQRAKHAIRTHHCTLARIKHSTSRAIRSGHVISQKPTPGTRLKNGAGVHLVISRGRH